MTVTSPASGARAPHRRPIRRLLATGFAALLALGVSAPATAATPTPDPSATAEALSGALDLSVAPGSSGMLRPEQALTLTVSLENGLEIVTPATEVTISLGVQPIADRRAVDAWLDSGDTDASAQDIAVAVLPEVESGSTATASATVLPDDAALAGRPPGVYSLRATTTADGEEVTARSVVTVPGESSTPISVIVPITAGTLDEGLLTADELERLTDPDGALTAQLGAVEGTAAIIAIDPAIPASIRVLGESAPATAVSWLERLMNLSNSRFALQFGDADVAAQLQSGLPAPLQPTSLLAYMDPADFTAETAPTPTPTLSPSPTASPAPDGPVLPDLATLTDIGGEPRDGTYWPATGSAGTDVVSTLGGLPSNRTTPLTLLASTSTAAGADGATVPAAGDAGGASVLVYDAAISDRLTVGADAASDAGRADALAAATAHLSFASAEAAGRPLLVAIDRGEDRSRVELRGAVATALSASGAGTLTLEQLSATAAEPVTVAEVPADLERSADTTLLMGDEAAIGGFATILDDPQLLTGPQRAEMLQLLAVAWRDDPEAAREAVAAHRTETGETLDSVGIVSTNVVLVSYGSEGFRPYVRNDLDYPVNLRFSATSDTSSLRIGERDEEVRAEAGSNTLVSLPIEARIANATAIVSMQLYSPSGVAIGAVESATVEVHAEWETIGLVVLGALMVLFLTGGIIRTVLRRRRARGEQNDEADVDDSATPAGGSTATAGSEERG
jgi:hypothetical protein